MARVRLLPHDPRKGHLRQRVGVAGISGTFEAGVWRTIRDDQVPLLSQVKQPNGGNAWEVEAPTAPPAKDEPTAPPVPKLTVNPVANMREHMRTELGVEPIGDDPPAAEPTTTEATPETTTPPAAGPRPRRVRGAP